MPSVFPPIKADTLEELAEKMELPPDKLRATIDEFNAACGETSAFHPTELDGVATTGTEPRKTNWARPITEAPFFGYSLRYRRYIHLSRVESGRQRPMFRHGRQDQEPLGCGRNDGRVDPRPRLSRWVRHDHRYRLWSHRRQGGRS